MALNLSQLLKKVTRQSAVDLILQELASLGFSVVKFTVGKAQRNHIEVFSELFKVASDVIPALAEGGLLGLSTDLWLDFLGQRFYGLTRQEATNAEHTVVLTSTANHSWPAGGLVVATAAPDSRSFSAVIAGSISAGDTESITVRALIPGSKSSVGVNTIVVVVSPFAGLSVNNPAIPSLGNSMTVVGVDKESDARFTRRCELRFASLTYSAPRNAYELWALEADATITRVSVGDPVGDSTVVVVCATALGGITAAQITTITNYIEDGRRPINDVVTVQSAVPITVPIVAVPTVRKGEYATPAAASTALSTAWDAFFAALPIGGRIVAPSISGQVLRDELIEIAMVLSGFRRANVTTPSGDVGLSANEVAVGSYTITIVEESP